MLDTMGASTSFTHNLYGLKELEKCRLESRSGRKFLERTTAFLVLLHELDSQIPTLPVSQSQGLLVQSTTQNK